MTPRLHPFPAASRSCALLAAVVVLLLAASLRAAEPEYLSIAGVKAAGFQKWLDDAKEQGYAPWYFNGYDVGDHAEFAFVAVKDPNKTPFAGRFDMTSDEYQQWIDEMRDKGFRPRSVTGYRSGKSTRFAGAWIKDKYTAAWKIIHNQGKKDFEAAVSAMHDDGLEPTCVTAYQGPSGGVHFTAMFYASSPGQKYDFQYDMTAAKYQAQIDLWKKKGLRPTCVSVYDSPDGQRFLATAVAQKNNNPLWQARQDMSADKYQKEFDKQAEDGFKPFCICGYLKDGEVNFAAIWTKKE